MRKSLFFLSCIIGLLTLAGCSKDDSAIDSGNNTKSTKIRWYGVNTSDEISTRGVADESKLWNPKGGISIKFINNPAKTDMIEKIKIIIAEWEHYAGIRFKFVDNSESASVRIAFDWQGNDWLTWSYTGTDAKYVRSQAEPTAVFGGLQYQDEEQFRGDVLRVFGQILGLEYEQRHQDWTFWRDEAKLQSYWTDMFDGMNMDWAEIREYVFTPLTGNNAIFPNQTPKIDELSVMSWPYYARTQTTKLFANYELSDGDKAFIATLYPKDKQTLLTIQEAWVDAGYFEWTDNTKTALTITKLGANQEYLPDVSDGEQLTSAYHMFSFDDDSESFSNLKIAPFFNTSNITNFSRMFTGCSYLTAISLLDTSNGELFYEMFRACNSLRSIPQLNTSSGISFNMMFFGCNSLTSIPQLDTSKGIDFTAMFAFNPSLTSIPLLDTSNGTIFIYMFNACPSLTEIPPLNTSKGTIFYSMFGGCSSLFTIPLLNTARGEDFAYMFYGCTMLHLVPDLDTSNGSQFYYMFSRCPLLKAKPNLEIPKGSNTQNMYQGTVFENY